MNRNMTRFFPILFFILLLTCIVAHPLSAIPAFSLSDPFDLSLFNDSNADNPPDDSTTVEGCDVKARVIKGVAQVKGEDGLYSSGSTFHPIADGEIFAIGSTLTTEAGAIAELVFPNGSVVRIGPNSTLVMNAGHCLKEDPPFTLYLSVGSIWGKMASGTLEKSVVIQTKNGMVQGLEATYAVELHSLDTVIHKRVIDGYPAEVRGMFEGMDTTASVETKFEGSFTKVVVFEGEVGMKPTDSEKVMTAKGGEEKVIGSGAVPNGVAPSASNRFNKKGELVEK